MTDAGSVTEGRLVGDAERGPFADGEAARFTE